MVAHRGSMSNEHVSIDSKAGAPTQARAVGTLSAYEKPSAEPSRDPSARMHAQ